MKRQWLGWVSLALVLAAVGFGLIPGTLSTPPATAASDLSAPGSLDIIVAPGERLRSCPLEHTDVEGWITGDVALVRVTQRFASPYDEPVEAVYVFPLPANSAVNDMVMRIGDRTVRGVIKERAEAKHIYEEAKRAGKTTSLLEQERPNIFTQSVANIMPGDPVEITIWYVQDLHYDRGRYEFVFPMVVGPRYIPGRPAGEPSTGGGWSPDTDAVPDASRITPPVLKPDERTGHDISLTVHLDAGVPAHDVDCTSHDFVEESYDGRPLDISLAAHDTIPNKDFILSWRVAGERPEVGLLTHRDERSGYFTLILQPKADFDPGEITPKEMLFCLDTSGSMRGLPIEKSKEVVQRCLQEMGPDDTFQVVRFAGDSATFAEEPVRATRANIARAADFIERMEGRGGTEMLAGIEACLAFPQDPKRVRIVAFLTDGYIGNESQILARIQDKLGDARIFSFGVGSSVNRYLLKKMAELGRGVAEFVRYDEDPDEAVHAFVDRISRPYLTDIDIDWGGLDAQEVYPPYWPDLFADQPVILHGRYEQPGEGTITIRGSTVRELWETRLSAQFPARGEENEALAVLWARACIEDLMDEMHSGEEPEAKAEIIDLALAYRLMSPYTSFVAVEERVVNRDGRQVTVQVPVPIPEGVDYEGVFGRQGDEIGRMVQYGYKGGGARGGAAGGAGGMGGGGGFLGGARAAAGRMRVGAAPAAAVAPKPKMQAPHEEHLRRSHVGTAWIAVTATGETAAGINELGDLVRAAGAHIGLPGGHPAAVPVAELDSLAEAERLRILVLTGADAPRMSAEARAALAKFVRAGGFVIVDSRDDAFYRGAVKLLQESLPEATFARVSPRHDVFQSDSMPFRLTGGCPVARQTNTVGPAQAMFIGDRMAVFISRGALSEAWSEPLSENTRGAYEMGVNLIAYALQSSPAKDADR
jgi:Ca-activated chloride channel family protein